MGYEKIVNNVRYHAKGSPFPVIRVRVNSLHSILAAVKLDFPPLLWTNSEISSRPEKQRDINEDGHE
jgi:hypothetical protein